ncbi:phosphatase PAP2/dual specificity phosphatase family protein [Variovorax rhizosphaerae]|uniref:Phosphatase PAP2/dual specificity phosphatase family protein n=1 Tax=Variovorax rhizosphaerae TaxID=1836200 RepID=A0ABU8WK95_9BURK
MISAAGRPWKRAAAWLVLLGPLFYAAYGFANWWATTRADVPSAAFQWEREIPFWPWTIFPYWTINVFYALSLFFGRSKHVVDRHALRLLSATVIAVSCFVLWPLQFSFGQPPVEGAPAFLFDALRGFDKPFNQAPSLHIALAVILWDWYQRLLTNPWARLVLHLWTFAICASVLTTWQHHFIDIPTGALLGLFCVWLWPLERVPSMPRVWALARDPQRWKLAAFYAIGAAACLAAGLRLGGGALWLGWPAASLALVALNYLGFGARGFQMNARGRMAWAARWLLLPYRAGAGLNAMIWTRRMRASSEVLPGLWLGRIPDFVEWLAAGKPRMVSLSAELQLPTSAGSHCLPMLDLVVPSPEHLRRAALIIEAQHRTGGTVWICCALGFSRSAASLVGWIAAHSRDAKVAQALADAEELVRQTRPQIVLRPAWRIALAQAISENDAQDS